MKITKKSQVAFIRQQITTNARWARRALIALFEQQTEEEKTSEETVVYNNAGFTGCDAYILTSLAKSYLQYNNLTDKQMALLYKKIGKYANQIYNMSDKDKLIKAMSIAETTNLI